MSFLYLFLYPHLVLKYYFRLSLQSLLNKGQDYCKRIYEELSKALYEGGVDGFLLESLNCWEEAYFALEGVKAMKKVIYSKLQ